MNPTYLYTEDFPNNRRGPFFNNEWSDFCSQFRITAKSTVEDTAKENIDRVIHLADMWRKVQSTTPVGLQLYDGLLKVLAIITGNDAFIIACDKSRSCVLDSKRISRGIVFKPAGISQGEFFLKTAGACADVGNKLLFYFDDDKDNVCIVASGPIRYNTSEDRKGGWFLHVISRLDYDTVFTLFTRFSNPAYLPNRNQSAYQKMTMLLASEVLAKTALEGNVDRMLTLIGELDVPIECYERAMQVAKENRFQKIVNTLDLLFRMTGFTSQ